MQKKLVLSLLFLASLPLLGATLQSKWTAAQVDSALKVCTSAALQTNPKVTSKQADYYCKCTLYGAATKWAYSDFVTKEEEYTKQMLEEGAIAKCTQEALQIKASPSELNQNQQIKQVLESGGQDLLNHRK
jgi:MarR-like DNA-binding transcriptional regulator SgrR of sgrS sRNA